MAAAPELVDDLVEEVLLRIPPDDPAGLARAALASKRWCRVATGRSFRRRFRERHRRAAPPVLGLLYNLSGPNRGRGRGRGGDACASSFVPTSSFRLPCAAAGPGRGWRVLDARHGRVLLANLAWEKGHAADALVLWDPITGDRLELPELPRHMETLPWTSWNAAVLCAAGFPSTSWKATISFPFGMPSTGWNPLRWPPLQPHEPPVSSTAGGSNNSACDHMDCRRGPFLVALVGVNTGGEVFGHVYSSEGGDWSRPTSCFAHVDLDCNAHSVLVGNTVYFKCEMKLGSGFCEHKILKYDLSTPKMCTIHLPFDSSMGEMTAACVRKRGGMSVVNGQRIVLMTTEGDAGLGLARVHDSKLQLWAREDGSDNGEWVPRRLIDFEKLIPTDALSISPELFGSLDGGEVFFVLTASGLFSINLRSGQARKLHGGSGIRSVVPYSYFCTPALGALTTGEKRAGSSSA